MATSAAEPLLQLLALLRAVYSLHQTHHWNSKGANYYADHQLFQRLYEGITPEIDMVAERALGLGAKVDYVPQAKLKAELLAGFAREEQAAQRSMRATEAAVVSSLSAEETVLSFIDKLMRGRVTQGTQNLLQSIADKHEGHVYLLQQRLEG